MPYRNFTLDELARHLGIDARELKRMTERGTLPGQMIGGQWRFNRAEMLDWLQREMYTLDEPHLRSLERAMSEGREETVVSSSLALEAINLELHAKSKASVLRELVALAERTGLVYDPAGLVTALQEREELRSTALAGGFALPHPRTPLPYATAEPLICLARVPSGVPFGAPDGELTDLFFLIVSHEERQHLHVLARLAMMLSTELPDALRELAEPRDALELILRVERDLLNQRGRP